MGAPFEFRLAADAFEWRKGIYKGRTPYDRIRRIRLVFRPMTMQNYRFLTEVWTADGPKLQIASTLVEEPFRARATRRSLSGFRDRADPARRARRVGKPCSRPGSPPFLYWPGVVVFVGASLALVALIVRALRKRPGAAPRSSRRSSPFFPWQAGVFFHRNRPGKFDPAAVPPQVLPRA